ncbi:MAG: hypothetical protein LBH98_06475 [Chitinispirillales bacterium]|jgi:hypothetical protein|nr:hypothetical protein [Chitinispirillales bacterium]
MNEFGGEIAGVNAPKAFKVLLVTSKSVNDAENLLCKKFSEWCECGYGAKMKFLENNFNFSLVGRFTLETDEESKKKEDYFATLQYLISEARYYGIKSVI